MKKIKNMTFDEFVKFLGIEESIEDSYMEDLSNDYAIIQSQCRIEDDFICFIEDAETRDVFNSRVCHGLCNSFIIGQYKSNIGSVESISVDEMKNYGYLWEGMCPLTMKEAIERYKKDRTIYKLFKDNSEAMISFLDDIHIHGQQGGIFGIEIDNYTRDIKAILPFDEDKMCTTKEGTTLLLGEIEKEFNLWKEKILKLDPESFYEQVTTIVLCKNIFDYFNDFGYRYVEEGLRVVYNVLKDVRTKDLFTIISEDYKNIEEGFNIEDYDEIESYLNEFGERYQFEN